MSDVFREVDEDLRRDRASEVWKRHGSKLIAGAFAIVLSVGGWRVYETYQQKERAAFGASFDAALAEIAPEKPESLASLTALAQKNAGAYAQLAKFRLASELANSAKDEAGRVNAVSAFDALAQEASLPAAWRELAKIRAAFLLVDSAPLADLEARLLPLTEAKQGFRHSAREALALAFYRANAMDRALSMLEQVILDPESPTGLRQRAELMLALVRSGPKP
jgi:hypothetical protein